MEKLFLANDVLSSEMNDILGGGKVTVTYKDKNGNEVTVAYEW